MKRFFAVILVALTYATVVSAQDDHVHDHDHFPGDGHVHDAPAPPDWDQKTLDLFATLPIQDGGRVKPLDTFAGFALLNLNANRDWKATAESEEKRTHIEWLLNTLFFPETARQYEIVFVENADVLDAIGISHEGKKRYARYSYEQLEPGFAKLFELAPGFAEKDPKQQSAFERQTVALATKVQILDTLLHAMDWARVSYPANTSDGLKLIFNEAETVTYTDVLRNAKALQHLLSGIDGGIDAMDESFRAHESEALTNLLGDFVMHASRPNNLNILPPVGDIKDESEWFAPTGPMGMERGEPVHSLMDFAFKRDKSMDENLAMLGALGELARVRTDSMAFTAKLEQVHSLIQKGAEERSEYAAIPVEVKFYRGQYFWHALIYFAFAFVVSAFVWLKPGSKHWFWRAHWWVSMVMLAIPTAYLIYGIVLRCIIRQRPPITNLYETVLFITAVLVLVALIIEFINRRKIALPTGAFLGLMGMFLANRYEAREAVDTMPSLVAVLDTNFWLATHVTIVNIGYAAGVLAAAIAHVYIFGKLFGFKKNDKKFYTDITRMVYGTICFGICFSSVGTILGGIWANDSWGRFWGWDPKENGALMIVLWQLFMLHGRMGGYLRHYGLNIAAVFGGIIVAFSWWHVNYLGVGLHSYGFTDGIVGNLVKYYTLEMFVILCGFAAYGLERLRGPEPVPASKKKGKKAMAIPEEVPAK